jgi:phosphoribosylformylglycinamidine synthase
MKVIVTVRLKSGVLDPQGKAIESAMHNIGLEAADNVRAGKIIEFNIPDDTDQATLESLCDKLLANPVMEDYTIKTEKAA